MKNQHKINTIPETVAFSGEKQIEIESTLEFIETAEAATFPEEFTNPENPLVTFDTEGLKETHESEQHLFVRHNGIPAHDQELLQKARIHLVGGGGLGSYAGLGLIKSGVKFLTISDHDRVDRTNLSRQFFTKEDLGQLKGVSLARNLADHAAGGATITGIGRQFEETLEKMPLLPADILVVGVDNNACRLAAVQEARRRRIPAVFTMLSINGMRCQVFLQGAFPLDPCLWCALPNLDPERILPCASAIISSCFLASALTIFFVHRALMGWGNLNPFNWREADLSGETPDRTGIIRKRDNCEVCQGL